MRSGVALSAVNAELTTVAARLADTYPESNRNRTVSEIRHCFGKNGGNMAEAGAVAYMFHKKGDILIPKSATKADELMNIIIDANGEDEPIDDGENWEILTAPSAYEGMLEAVKKADREHAVVVRVSEAWGTRGRVRLATSLPVTSATVPVIDP